MKVQIISQYYYPDNFRINEIARELANRGDDVCVLTGLPDYSTSRVPQDYKWLRRRRETINTVQVTRVPVIARRSGVFFRILNYGSFMASSAFHALFAKKNFDVLFVNQTSPVFQAFAAVLLRRLSHKPLVLYCYDLWPESLKAWNLKESSVVFRATARVSAWLYNRCDCIAITSRPFAQYLRNTLGIPAEKIQYLPQYAEDDWPGGSCRYLNNGCIDFLFAGNVGAVQDVEVILQALARCQSRVPVMVHIVGDGSRLEACRNLAHSLGITDRVVFHGRYPQSEMNQFYELADCLLLTLRGGDFIGKTLPGKAQGYLCTAKPVLAAIDGAGYDLVTEADCGLAVPAGDIDALATAMKKIAESFELYRQKGRNGRAYYETHFTKEVFMQSLTELLGGCYANH